MLILSEEDRRRVRCFETNARTRGRGEGGGGGSERMPVLVLFSDPLSSSGAFFFFGFRCVCVKCASVGTGDTTPHFTVIFRLCVCMQIDGMISYVLHGIDNIGRWVGASRLFGSHDV